MSTNPPDRPNAVDLLKGLQSSGAAHGTLGDMRFACPYCGQEARALVVIDSVVPLLRVGHVRPACDAFRAHEADPWRVLMDATDKGAIQ